MWLSDQWIRFSFLSFKYWSLYLYFVLCQYLQAFHKFHSNELIIKLAMAFCSVRAIIAVKSIGDFRTIQWGSEEINFEQHSLGTEQIYTLLGIYVSPQRIFCSWVYTYFVVKFRTLVMGETKEILTKTIPKKTYMYPCELTLAWQMEHTDHCPLNWCCSGLAWQLEHTDHCLWTDAAQALNSRPVT